MPTKKNFLGGNQNYNPKNGEYEPSSVGKNGKVVKDADGDGKTHEGWDFDEESKAYTSKDGEVFSEKEYKEIFGGEKKTEDRSGISDAISKANESESKMNVTEPVKEVEHDDIYDESKKDKYGNSMLSEKYREIGKEAAKRYVEDMLQYYSMEQLTKSFVFPRGIMEEFSNAVYDATDWQAELTEKELEDIVSEVTGYDFDYQTFENPSGKPYFRKK